MSTIQVSFKDDESRAKARWIILTNRTNGISSTVVNRPPRDLVIDTEALRLLKEANIKVYPPATNGSKTSYRKELNISKILFEVP